MDVIKKYEEHAFLVLGLDKIHLFLIQAQLINILPTKYHLLNR